MPENVRQLKRDKFLFVVAVVCFVLVFCASLFLAVIAPVFTSNNVARAIDLTLPDNGVVGNNIILNSDYSFNTSGSTSWSSRGRSVLTVDNWYLFNGDLTFVDSLPRINFDSTQVANVYSRFYTSSFSLLPGTYTASACYDYLSGGGTSRFRFIKSDLSSFGDSLSGSSYVDLVRTSGVRVSSFTFTITDSFSSVCLDFYSSSLSSGFVANLYWVKLEKGSSFTGYVPNSYENYGYNQGYEAGNTSGYNSGYDKGYIEGLNKYVDNNAITSNLNVDSYFSTGGFSFLSSLTSPYVEYNILNAFKVENYTRTSGVNIASPYDALKSGINYNLIYSQGSFSASSNKFTGGAGFYGVKSSLIGSNAFNSFINAGTPFSLECISARRSVWDNAISGSDVNLFVCFLDRDGSILRFNENYTDAYYLDSIPFSYLTDMRDGIFILDTLSSGALHYYRLPVDVYGFILFSYHEDSDVFRAYSMKCNFLPNSDYQSIYDSGFKAGQSDINTGAYYNNGYNVGYQEGVIKGASEANNYSFLGVIGAMIDAPLNSILALLDFDLLGFNMKGLFSALLMLSFIILIIRLLLGGK